MLPVESSDVMTGTTSDVTRVSRQLLNRALAHRTIGKPEAVVELIESPLCLSSEVTETINISGSYKVSSDNETARWNHILQKGPAAERMDGAT